MKVGELKELLKNIPDDYDVIVDCPDDEAGYSVSLCPNSLDIYNLSKQVMLSTD